MIRDMFLCVSCLFITSLTFVSDISDVPGVAKGDLQIVFPDSLKKRSQRDLIVLKYTQNKIKSLDSLQELMQKQSDEWDADLQGLIDTAQEEDFLDIRNFYEAEQERSLNSCDTFFARDDREDLPIVYGELKKSIEQLDQIGPDSLLKNSNDKAVLFDDCF